MKINEIVQEKEKVNIAETILRSLSDWFGIEESTQAYINGCRDKPMYVIKREDKVVGFVSLKEHFKKSCELYVLGVSPEFHRKGLGRKLIY